MRNIIIMVLALVFAAYTGSKLYGMAQLRGWVPGAQHVTVAVTQKYIGWERRAGNVYWVSWTQTDVHTPGSHRVDVTHDEWQHLDIGSSLALVYISTTAMPFTPTSVWAEDGQFVFDGILLAIELGVAFVMGASFVLEGTPGDARG